MTRRFTGRASIGEVMDAAPLVSPPRLSGARALVLLVTMAGLFAMHGLTDHGATHWGEHTTMSAATPLVTHAQSHDLVAADDGPHSTAGASVEAAIDSGGGRLPADMGLIGLCLAVLALASLVATTLMRATPVGGPARPLSPGNRPVGRYSVRPTHPIDFASKSTGAEGRLASRVDSTRDTHPYPHL